MGIYFIEKTKIRYGWDLFYWKSWNKVQLKIHFIEKVKVRYGLGLNHWKGQKKARLDIYFTEHKKIDLISCGFISLKMLRYFIAESLFHSKCWDKVQLWIYSNEKSQNRIYSIEKAEISYGCGNLVLSAFFHYKRKCMKDYLHNAIKYETNGTSIYPIY